VPRKRHDVGASPPGPEAAAPAPAPAGAAKPADEGLRDPYAAFVQQLAAQARAAVVGRLDTSSVLSSRAKLIDGAAWLAGTASAEWYLTAEIASPGDGGGPGLGALLRWRASVGTLPSEDEFLCVAVICTFFYLFGVMADRDRLSTARTFVAEIAAPASLGEMAEELERAYPTRRPGGRPETDLRAYLTLADRRLAALLGVNNSPGLSLGQVGIVLQRFNHLFRENLAPIVGWLS